MEEIIFNVRIQQDGWYIATADYTGGSIVAEGNNYATLKQSIIDLTFHHFGVCREIGTGASRSSNPKIRLKYTELLLNNPSGDRVLIVGTLENNVYRATAPIACLNDSRETLEILRERLRTELASQNYQDKHVDFILEEVLEPESSLVS